MASIGDDITRRLIKEGGIKPGMKILDLGCGNGNVTFLVSEFIGSNGLVLGIDSNENAIISAKKKSIELKLSNTDFHTQDITKSFELEHSDFDAIIVRRVLMYLPNPENTIRLASKYLKKDGLFLVQENDMSLIPIGLDSMPQHKKIIDLIKRTLEKENVNLNMGFDLNNILSNSGLKVQRVWAEATLSTRNQETPWAFLAEVMKERMLNQKVINDFSELGLETIKERLTNERLENDRTFISDLVFCGIGKK